MCVWVAVSVCVLLGSIIINALCSICVGLCTLKLIGKLSPDLFTIMHLVFMVGPCMMTRMRTAGFSGTCSHTQHKEQYFTGTQILYRWVLGR